MCSGTASPPGSSPDLDKLCKRARSLGAATLAAVLAVCGPSVAAVWAQEGAGQPAVVVGRVLDAESGEPIETVEVRLVGEFEALVAVTDGEGAFLFPRVRRGEYEVVLTHLAYGTQTDTIEVGEGELVRYEARLRMRPIELAPLVATVERGPISPMHLGFYERMALHVGGTFITREEIERRQPVRISHAIAEFPGVRLGPRGVRFTRYGDCAPAVYVDRMYMGQEGGDVEIDRVVIPTEVEAVEFYKGLASLPAAFAGPASRCGVIVIWTRRGPAPSEAAERRAYLGVVTGLGTARFFRGLYTNGQFTIDEAVTAGAFPLGQPLPCLSSRGEAENVTVDSLAPYNPTAWDEPDLMVTVQPGDSPEHTAGILFWTGEPRIERAAGREVALDSAARELIESETRWLWREAVDQLPAGERDLEMSIEREDVRAFGSDLITVHRYPVIGSS
ncbi:MAG: carboxypeptidase regulatory-like domain-containing protein, partial [Gemmatimonadales bacterium]